MRWTVIFLLAVIQPVLACDMSAYERPRPPPPPPMTAL